MKAKATSSGFWAHWPLKMEEKSTKKSKKCKHTRHWPWQGSATSRLTCLRAALKLFISCNDHYVPLHEDQKGHDLFFTRQLLLFLWLLQPHAFHPVGSKGTEESIACQNSLIIGKKQIMARGPATVSQQSFSNTTRLFEYDLYISHKQPNTSI